MSIWAILSLSSGIINLIIAIYILSKRPKELLNRVFSLFVFSFSIWGFSEVVPRITSDPLTAYMWIRFGGLGWCFMLSLYLHFVLVFARQAKWLKNWFTYVILYFPPVIFLNLFMFTDLIYKQTPVYTFYGYTSFPGDFVWSYVVYYSFIYFFAIYFLVRTMFSTGTLRKNQTKPILLGCTVILVIGTLTNVVFPALGIPFPEIATTTSLLWMGCNFYAVLRHRLFIDPIEKKILIWEQKYNLEKGSYMVKEPIPEKSYKIFFEQIYHGKDGLCFTKLSPDRIKKKYEVENPPVIWISFKEGDNIISPKGINTIEQAISEFIKSMKTPFIFLDCFFVIMMINGWGTSLKWINRIKEKCRVNNSFFLISINPDMFEEEQLTFLEEEFIELK